MNRFVLIALVAGALGVGARTEPQPPQQASTRTGLIVGQVVDAANGRPIGGAIVTIGGAAAPAPPAGRQMLPSSPPRILTGADGRFVFRDLARGSFTIAAAKSGYADGASGRRRPGGASQPITLADGERLGNLVVRMWKYGAITGTVVDEAGEPLVSIQVRAFRGAIVAGRRRFVGGGFALTDDRGMYRFGSLVPDEYIVAAAGRQIAVPLAMAQELQNRGFPGTADLGPPPSLPGTATSTQVAGIVYSLGRGVPIPAPAADGRLFVYPPTFYPSVIAFPQATPVVVASGEERTAIDLQLHPLPTARISGTVVGPDGPATALSLRLFPSAAADVALEQDIPVAITDRNGAFTFPAVPSGQYSLRGATRPQLSNPSAPLEPMVWTELPIAVGRANIDGIALVLQPGLRATGHLEFEGGADRPVAASLQQVPIFMEPADAAPTAGIATGPGRVDAGGQFTTAGVVPGKYLVRVLSSPTGWMFKSATYKGRNVADEPFDLESGDATDVVILFTDRWTGLRGTVQSRRNAPDADASVLVFPMDSDAWTNYGANVRRMRSVRTSRTGEYSLHSLPAGDYYVVAVPDDRAADWQDPKFLEALVPIASRLTIGEGEQKVLGLRTREVR